MPKLERVFPSRTSSLADGRFSTQERAEHTELLPAGALRNAQCDPPIVQPLRAVSSIVADIFHDLRQPLTAILANAEFSHPVRYQRDTKEGFLPGNPLGHRPNERADLVIVGILQGWRHASARRSKHR
jgi:signal transduction histidine kinase